MLGFGTGRQEGWQVNHKLVRRWLARLGVQTLFIEPGSPWENGYNESFNGTLREENTAGRGRVLPLAYNRQRGLRDSTGFDAHLPSDFLEFCECKPTLVGAREASGLPTTECEVEDLIDLFLSVFLLFCHWPRVRGCGSLSSTPL